MQKLLGPVGFKQWDGEPLRNAELEGKRITLLHSGSGPTLFLVTFHRSLKTRVVFPEILVTSGLKNGAATQCLQGHRRKHTGQLASSLRPGLSGGSGSGGHPVWTQKCSCRPASESGGLTFQSLPSDIKTSPSRPSPHVLLTQHPQAPPKARNSELQTSCGLGLRGRLSVCPTRAPVSMGRKRQVATC